MGKQPSAIIIVRHGTRLDQADKAWRATAEHPYDPPLSYGGWIQCQTLGARIDRELQSLYSSTPNDLDKEEHGLDVQHSRKKKKIIIHTSPYKRCLQTSVAIAAGLRYPQPEQLRPLPTAIHRSSLSSAPRNSVAGFELPPRSQPLPRPVQEDDKIDLKVDPYLGEWLSPSYFEDSKPPPSTDLIEDRARETLTKPLQEIRGADLSAFLPVPESPGADETEKENETQESIQNGKGGLRAMAAVGHSLPHRTRATSFGRDAINGSQLNAHRGRQRATTANVYSPPVPQYSLAPQDPIPAGYVTHAKDGCVQPDLDWNSVKMGWGDGGTYPEDWSSMHVRFRQGLQKMMVYYEDYETPETPASGEHGEVNEDLVLVLVTHQAGANALIRLMTGAPALHDVGVSSLTLAVRRPVLRRPPSLAGTSHSPLGYGRESRKYSRRGSLDLGLADEFEMRIIASTEHLRFGSNPLGLNSPRLNRSPATTGRKTVGADSLEGFSIGDPLTWRPGSSGNLGRGSGQLVRSSDGSTRSSTNSGLWGSPAIPAAVKELTEESFEELPPVSPKSRPTTPGPGVDEGSLPEMTLSSPTRTRSSTVQSAGLWGSNGSSLSASRSTSGEAGGGTWGSMSRARSPAKRRWTAVSNSP